jgi:hypothetical protein
MEERKVLLCLKPNQRYTEVTTFLFVSREKRMHDSGTLLSPLGAADHHKLKAQSPEALGQVKRSVNN